MIWKGWKMGRPPMRISKGGKRHEWRRATSGDRVREVRPRGPIILFWKIDRRDLSEMKLREAERIKGSKYMYAYRTNERGAQSRAHNPKERESEKPVY